jgi:hypothetical protein
MNKILKTKKYSILSGLLKYSFVIVFGAMLLSPFVFVSALEGTGTTTEGTGTEVEGTGSTTIISKIENPLGSGIDDIPSFIKKIIEIVLYIGVPIVALSIIYTGFLFVKAQGNPEQLTKAKNALVYTLIGGALLLGAFVIAEAIGKTVEDIKSTT